MSFSIVQPLPGAVVTTYWMGYPGHTGIDLAKPQGTAIRAAAAGTVLQNKYHVNYGNMLDINHGNGYVTRYAHMQYASPRPVGSAVTAGQTIGNVGSTGNSTGPHLHFEILINGNPVDPWPYLKNAPINPPTPPTPPEKGITVIHYKRQDKFSRQSGRNITPGSLMYLHTSSNVPTAASNIVGGVGYYSITPHVYAEGTPGDVLTLYLVVQTNPGTANVSNSYHYEEQLVIGKNGRVRASVESKMYVGGSAPVAVYARLDAASTNAAAVKTTVFDTDAYLIDG